ncbi:MAG: pantoate--beta-alanine ligase [Chitinivibrionales bacterium]|nr:pantoate--beta-alanine ligase [Chitinivibrionales bacterium]
MKIVLDHREMSFFADQYRAQGKTIGFVPTMGALHAGHLSLLEAAKKACDISVMSIFVNPTQFAPHEDFAKYPRPFEQDCRLASEAGCDILFAPEKKELYPEGFSTFIKVEGLSEALCGGSRPDHFRGVATIVCKLINIVKAHKAVFGQKDAQQAIILKRMACDLNMTCAIVVAPTLRLEDGLAMSSRNNYLSSAERNAAAFIYKGLQRARELHEQGERQAHVLKQAIQAVYAQTNVFAVEYVEIVNTTDLQALAELKGATLVAVACRTGETHTRLIDNIVLGGSL